MNRIFTKQTKNGALNVILANNSDFRIKQAIKTHNNWVSVDPYALFDIIEYHECENKTLDKKFCKENIVLTALDLTYKYKNLGKLLSFNDENANCVYFKDAIKEYNSLCNDKITWKDIKMEIKAIKKLKNADRSMEYSNVCCKMFQDEKDGLLIDDWDEVFDRDRADYIVGKVIDKEDRGDYVVKLVTTISGKIAVVTDSKFYDKMYTTWKFLDDSITEQHNPLKLENIDKSDIVAFC